MKKASFVENWLFFLKPKKTEFLQIFYDILLVFLIFMPGKWLKRF